MKTNTLYGTTTITMIVMSAAVAVGISAIPASIRSNNAFALDTLCSTHHQCHCIATIGVYYDFDPEVGQLISINNGCTDDNR